MKFQGAQLNCRFLLELGCEYMTQNSPVICQANFEFETTMVKAVNKFFGLYHVTKINL